MEKATEETAVDTQKLIQCPDNDVQDEILKQRRTKSADLLKKELEKHGKAGTREYLAKVMVKMLFVLSFNSLQNILINCCIFDFTSFMKLLFAVVKFCQYAS